MVLRSLKLVNFRNYSDFQIDFLPITVFVGSNGIGKTNLIEAIYDLSVGKSYRTSSSDEAIKWNEDFFRITGVTNEDELQIFIDKGTNTKIAKINGVKKRSTDLFGKLKIVLFSPESMEIVTGSPKIRRRFLDLILAQNDKKYLFNLLELNKILKNRNSLLQGIRNNKNKKNELDFWNTKLVELSIPIITKRIELIKYLNKIISDYYSEISNKKNNLEIKYVPTVSDLDNFFDLIEKNLNKEIMYGASIFGPHRDDVKFILNNKEVGSFASRGETRSVLFSLKLAELEFLKENNANPLLLLDDIFSELDKKRREKLCEIIKNQPTVITTTDLDFLSSEIIKKAKIVKLGEL